MKRLVIIVCSLLAIAATQARNNSAAPAAQSNNPKTEVQSDTIAPDSIPVVAYFCKRDTMNYRYTVTQRVEQSHPSTPLSSSVNGGIAAVTPTDIPTDTVYKSAFVLDFMLCITDSTPDGYRMEYVATDFFKEDTISVDIKALMHQRVFERIKGKKIIFQLSQVGELLQLVNWQDVRDPVIQGIFTAYNEIYPKVPGLEQILPKGQLMGLVSQSYQTEDGLKEWFKELLLLFNSHGRIFPLRTEWESEGSDTEFPSSSIAVSGLEKTGDDGNKEPEFDDDYYVMAETETRLKGQDIAAFYRSKGGPLGEGNALSKAIEELHASDIAEKELVVTDGFYIHYFFNGWPNAMESRNEETIGNTKVVEDRSVDWLSRSWYNY